GGRPGTAPDLSPPAVRSIDRGPAQARDPFLRMPRPVQPFQGQDRPSLRARSSRSILVQPGASKCCPHAVDPFRQFRAPKPMDTLERIAPWPTAGTAFVFRSNQIPSFLLNHAPLDLLMRLLSAFPCANLSSPRAACPPVPHLLEADETPALPPGDLVASWESEHEVTDDIALDL